MGVTLNTAQVWVAIGSIAALATAVLGFLPVLSWLLRSQTKALVAQIDAGDQTLSARIDSAETNLTARIDAGDQALGARIDSVDSRLDRMEGRLDRMDGRLSELTGDVAALSGRVGVVEDKVDTLGKLLHPITEELVRAGIVGRRGA